MMGYKVIKLISTSPSSLRSDSTGHTGKEGMGSWDGLKGWI